MEIDIYNIENDHIYNIENDHNNAKLNDKIIKLKPIVIINDFWHNIVLMPREIKDMIWSYVDNRIKLFTTKYYYQMYHINYASYFKINKTTYFRNIIKNDCDFILQELLHHNFNDIYNFTRPPLKIHYKKNIYTSYLVYIKYIAQENNAHKCLVIIHKIVEDINNYIDDDKKNFKIKSKYKQWTN